MYLQDVLMVKFHWLLMISLNGSKITFDAVGESAILVFTKGKWIMIAGTATLS